MTATPVAFEPLLRRRPESPTRDHAPEPEPLRRMYAAMVRARRFDVRGMALQRQGRISFFVPSFGEEAAVVGSAAALESGDWIVPQYREAGAAMVHGLSLQCMVDQLFGNGDDLLKGRQMPNHFGSAAVRFPVASSPVGTQIPQAVGLAWGLKLRREAGVVLVYFGDGATSTGDFHTGLNLAGVFRLPVVFLCKNNQYAISTPVARQTAAETLAEKALAYGLPGVRIDGNDLLEVYRTTRAAVERARSGGGPTMIEALTFRLGPHTSADEPSRYRAEAEVERWQPADPIACFRRYLEDEGLWDERQDRELQRSIDEEIQQAVAIAERTPPPALETLIEDVYETVPRHLEEQLAEVRRARVPPAPVEERS